MSDLKPSTRTKRSRTTIAQRVLASLVAGAEEISAAGRATGKRTENVLREALRGRWIAPGEDFSRLQIARLERMIAKLVDRLQKGDLAAINRALKIVDRLDRQRRFWKGKRLAEQYGEEERAQLLKKINDIGARLPPKNPVE